MQKLLAIAATTVLTLTGCASTPTTIESAKSVPDDRIYYKAVEAPNNANVVFVRDSGAWGSGTYFDVFVNDEKVASVDAGEKATLKLAPAEYVFGVKFHDPFGVWTPFAIDQRLEPNRMYQYRLTFDSGPPRIQRVMTK